MGPTRPKPYWRSRVSPGISATMASRVPVRTLNKVDFPTLGRPTRAMTGNISYWGRSGSRLLVLLRLWRNGRRRRWFRDWRWRLRGLRCGSRRCLRGVGRGGRRFNRSWRRRRFCRRGGFRRWRRTLRCRDGLRRSRPGGRAALGRDTLRSGHGATNRRRAEGTDATGVVDDEHHVARDDRRVADANLTARHTRSEFARRLVQPVHIALVVSSHNRVVSESYRGQSAVKERLLAPDLRARAAPQGHHLTVRIGYINGIVIERDTAIARGVVRPPDLTGVERKHRDATLEPDSEDVLPRDARSRVHVDETLQLGTAVRGSDGRLPLQRTVIHVDRDDPTVVEPTEREVAGNHRSRRATKRETRHLLLLRPQIVAVLRRKSAQLSINGTHGYHAFRDRGRCEDLAVKADPP